MQVDPSTYREIMGAICPEALFDDDAESFQPEPQPMDNLTDEDWAELMQLRDLERAEYDKL